MKMKKYLVNFNKYFDYKLRQKKKWQHFRKMPKNKVLRISKFNNDCQCTPENELRARNIYRVKKKSLYF